MIYLDLETYSSTPINHGTLNYAADAEIMLVGYALDDAPEKIWDVETGAPMPIDLYEALKLGDIVCAHNSFFDRNVMLRTEDFSGIALGVERWYDTMVQALAHGLPGGLDKLSEIFGLDKETAKDKRGRALIKLFCIPQKDGKRVRRTERPAESDEFNEYLRRDIRAMRAVHKLLPKTNFPVDPTHVERQAWFIDQHINDRGFAIDLELAEAAVETAKRMKTIHAGAADDLTLGAVSSTTKVEELRLFLNSTYHLGMHDMTASTVNRRLEDPELPAGARELLALRSESSKTSATKYATMLRLADSRGRVGGTLQFCGAARTGRSAGRGFQPHNLPRPAYGLKERHIEQGIEDIKAGVIEVMSDKPMEMLASCVRGAIVAPPGKRLDSSDLSNIEGRGLVYLSGEDWKLNYFRDFDRGTVPFDNYVMAYAKAMGVKPETVTKDQRQVGKVLELSCFASDTKVLTSNGVKDIIAVQLTDLLWDGLEWVQHKGLICQGLKETINLNGVHLTPEHLILTQGTWIPARQLALNSRTNTLALATGLESLQCLARSVENQELAPPYSISCSAVVVPNPMLSTPTTCAKVKAPGVTPVLKNKQTTGASNTLGTLTSYQTTTIDGDFSTGYPPAYNGARTQKQSSTNPTVGEVSGFTLVGRLIKNSFLGTLSRFLGGTTPTSNLTEPITTRGMNPETSVSLPSKTTPTTGGPSAKCSVESTSLRLVYDISNCGSRNRFTILSDEGALVVHNCGFQSGVNGILTFAKVYNLDMSEFARQTEKAANITLWAETLRKYDWAVKNGYDAGLPKFEWAACEYTKTAWRASHPATVQFWRDCEDAFKNAVSVPNCWFDAGPKVRIIRRGQWLYAKLPSGRALVYLQPKVIDGECSYMGMNQYTRKWERIKTYAGKLAENLTQAFARDILFSSIPNAEAKGYAIVLSVHDELVAEVPDTDKHSHGELSAIMSTPPVWAEDMPISAAGFSTYRYRKED